MGPDIIIPSLGIMTGIIIPLGIFVWLYLENKDKNKTILEISKNIDDPSKLEDLIGLLDERKKQPLDYRRNGVVSFCWNRPLLVWSFLFRRHLKRCWGFGCSYWYWSNNCWLFISQH